MSTSASTRGYKVSAALRAEAAAWIARLHGPNRTADVEKGFHRWLADAPEHAAAFELLTDIWEKAARLRRRPLEESVSWGRPDLRTKLSQILLASAALAALVVIGATLFLRSDGLTTAVGEQRTRVLEDGSRIYLNTDSEAIVHYDSDARRIELKRGEALFEVARHRGWPFIVTAGDKQVAALGTAFMVRRDRNDLAVTLVEGKVTVSHVTEKPDTRERSTQSPAALAAREHLLDRAQGEVITLSPGQRLTFASKRPPRVDHPAIDKVTAWRRGQVALDSTLLADAVAEMNRYSNVRLVIEDPRVAAIRVSGVFKVGDQENFARALARTYQLEVRSESREFILAGPAMRAEADSP